MLPERIRSHYKIIYLNIIYQTLNHIFPQRSPIKDEKSDFIIFFYLKICFYIHFGVLSECSAP